RGRSAPPADAGVSPSATTRPCALSTAVTVLTCTSARPRRLGLAAAAGDAVGSDATSDTVGTGRAGAEHATIRSTATMLGARYFINPMLKQPGPSRMSAVGY